MRSPARTTTSNTTNNTPQSSSSSSTTTTTHNHSNTTTAIPPEDFKCTQLIHTIFDRSVGNCFGGYPCTYSRQLGRLYVARHAVLFYSNLFGYERRLCMLLSDVTQVKLLRSTSIWISMMDGEDFMFRSLGDNRDRVVGLIRALLLQEEEPPVCQIEVAASTTLSSEDDDDDDETIVSATSNMTATDQLSSSFRTRAQSCPSDLMNQASPLFEMESIAEGNDSGTRQRDRNQSNGETSLSIATSTDEQRMVEAWSKEKEMQQSKFPEKAVDGLILDNSSLNSFFDQFLANDAPHSTAKYQQDMIGDTQVTVTKWMPTENNEIDDDSPSATMKRTISFCHPIGNNFGIGPSSTMATRKQTLRRYGNVGLCMETTTFVQGIPACDAFHVADRWLVETTAAQQQIQFTVLHETVFTKRTMFKRMIETSTKTEIKSWYKGYVSMLMKQTTQGGNRARSSSSETTPDALMMTASTDSSKAETSSSSSWRIESSSAMMFFLPVIGVVLLTVLLQNHFLQSQVQDLQVQLDVMQKEQRKAMQLIQAALTDANTVS